jgi:tetratricopeptide (TPR) repeat protein
VYYAKAVYLALSGRHSEALGVADAGLAINPNFVLLYIRRAAAENSLGRYDEAQADVEQPMRLSPHDILIPVFHVFVGEAEIGLGHFDAAIDEFHKGDRLGLWAVLCLHEPVGRLRASGQDGRGEDGPRRRPPPQSQGHGQMDDRAYAESATCVRRRPEGGVGGRMSETRKIAAILGRKSWA